jgi:hypothetical protein
MPFIWTQIDGSNWICTSKVKRKRNPRRNRIKRKKRMTKRKRVNSLVELLIFDLIYIETKGLEEEEKDEEEEDSSTSSASSNTKSESPKDGIS